MYVCVPVNQEYDVCHACIVEGWRKHCSRQYAGLGLCRCECNGARPEIHSNEPEWKLNENQQSQKGFWGFMFVGSLLVLVLESPGPVAWKRFTVLHGRNSNVPQPSVKQIAVPDKPDLWNCFYLFFLHQADGSTASLALPAFATSALPQRSCREKSGPQAPTKFSDSKTQRSVETCSETREFPLGRSVSGRFVDVWCRAGFDCDYFMCK